jgi:hypothetical protein
MKGSVGCAVPAGGHGPPYVRVDGHDCANLNNLLGTELRNPP